MQKRAVSHKFHPFLLPFGMFGLIILEFRLDALCSLCNFVIVFDLFFIMFIIIFIDSQKSVSGSSVISLANLTIFSSSCESACPSGNCGMTTSSRLMFSLP